jgi:hypothetical protein
VAEDRVEDTAAWIKRAWEQGDKALAQERRDYWLNYAFFAGEQWVYWHERSQEIAEFPRDRNSDRVRLTVNRVQPNLITVLAKLTKRDLTFEVKASGADDSTVSGARLGEHILEAHRSDDGWEYVRRDELFAAFLGGTSAVAIEWDPQAGETLSIDEANGNTIGTGEVRLTPLSIVEFTLEPGTRRDRDARWWMMAKAIPIEQAQEHYNLSWKPDADASAHAGPMQRRLFRERGYPTNVDLCTVYTYYERPNRKRKKGRMVVVIGNRTVYDRDWPFDFDDGLNIQVFHQSRLPQRWTGHSMVSDVRPLQVAYNHAMSNLAEHMKLAGNARLAIPDTSMQYIEDLTDEPGEIIPYDPTGGGRPAYLEPPNIPRWIIDHANRLEQKIDDLMYVHGISRGQAPGDRNSGLALSILAEKDETPLGLMSQDQAHGWARIGSLTLKLWEQKAIETREARVISDSGVALVREWTGKMLKGQTRAHVPLESVMPHSKAAMQAWMMDMADRFPQVMPQNPAVLARLMELPHASMFGELVDADVSEAEIENHLMSIGVIPALDDEPFPTKWQDHAKHIAEHNRFRKTRAYQYAPADHRQIVDWHIKAHENLATEQAIEQRQLNQTIPGAAAMPQADEPPNSLVPPDYLERAAPPAPAVGPGAGPL